MKATLHRALNSTWVGVNTSDPDIERFVISLSGQPVGSFVGCPLKDGHSLYHGWGYHANIWDPAKVQPWCDELALPYTWDNSILFHYGVAVYDADNNKICNTTRRLRIERMLNE